MKTQKSSNPHGDEEYSTGIELTSSLILFNDEHNVYDYVIDSLVEVCNHNRLQAEQCTLIAHHKGKCDVKVGSFDSLKPMKDELINRGLSAVIVSKN
jgi:ATP-dependent Clp protease adaptor protein ClpS